MRRAKFEVSEELLREALHMPETSTIINVRMEHLDHGSWIVIIADDPDLPEAAHPHECGPTVTRRGETLTWDWNVPLARLVRHSGWGGEQLIEVGPHRIEYGGRMGDRYCYNHRGYDCLATLTAEEQKAVQDARR